LTQHPGESCRGFDEGIFTEASFYLSSPALAVRACAGVNEEKAGAEYFFGVDKGFIGRGTTVSVPETDAALVALRSGRGSKRRAVGGFVGGFVRGVGGRVGGVGGRGGGTS
jgi:hypothetical protein